MKNYIYLIAALLLIGYGLVLLTRKKLIVSRAIEQSYVTTIILLNPIIMTIEDGILYTGLSVALGVYIAFIFFCYSFLRGKYTIYNVNIEEVTLLLEQILNGKNYDNEGVKIESSFLNTVEVNLKEIRDTKKHDDILHELKRGLQSIDRKFFSHSGIFYIVLGVFFILMVVK